MVGGARREPAERRRRRFGPRGFEQRGAGCARAVGGRGPIAVAEHPADEQGADRVPVSVAPVVSHARDHGSAG